MKIKQGDIILVPFPFSDLSSSKTRPALVISKKELPWDDILVCAITSKEGKKEFESVLDESSLSEGSLPVKSYVRIHKVATLNKNIVKAKLARINSKSLKEISNKLSDIIK